jgi:PAS domain S-box-containing protein
LKRLLANIWRRLRPIPPHWEAAIQGMSVGMIVVDSEGRVIDANPAAENLLDLRTVELMDQPIGDVFRQHPDLLTLYRQLLDSDITRDRRSEAALGENDLRTFVEIRLTPLTKSGIRGEDSGGHLILLQDITARKHSEMEAARHLAELAVLRDIDERIGSTLEIDDVLEIALTAATRLSGAEAGFIALLEDDGHQRVVKVAGKYPPALIDSRFPADHGIVGRVLRQRRAELINDVSSDPDYRPDLPITRAQIAIPLISRDHLIGVLDLETSDPSRFQPEVFHFVELLAGRIAAALENARLYSIAQTQVTELKMLYKQVSELEQLKTDMIRITSHDLIGPVGTVMGYLNLLEVDGDQLSPEHRRYVATMMGLSRRMERLINDILSLDRIQQNGLQHVPLELNTLVQQVVEDNRVTTRRKAHHLVMSSSGSPVIEGNAAQLQEAIANLVQNAVKYTPEGGRIEVKLREENGRAIFEVTDTGYGIPPDGQKRLFQPFYRVHMSETEHIEGTGLGLHLVKNIVERHDGEIIFRSQHGRGSTFGFALPLSQQKAHSG